MSELVPVSSFQLILFRSADELSRYTIKVVYTPRSQQNMWDWLEAAACLSNFAARNSGIGFEGTLETIDKMAMTYKGGPPPTEEDFYDIPPSPENPTNPTIAVDPPTSPTPPDISPRCPLCDSEI